MPLALKFQVMNALFFSISIPMEPIIEIIYSLTNIGLVTTSVALFFQNCQIFEDKLWMTIYCYPVVNRFYSPKLYFHKGYKSLSE